MLILAEISDKVGTFWSTLTISSIVVAFALAISRVWWPLYLLVIPPVVLGNWVHIGELQEVPFGQQIIKELGYGWVVGQFIAFNVPPLIGSWFVYLLYRRDRKQKRHAARACGVCGYPAEFTTCPECGSATREARSRSAPPAPS